MPRDLPYLRLEDGHIAEEKTHPVGEEVTVSLTVNGRNLMAALVSPDALEEFIIGFLFTEQIIHTIDEIESIRREKNSFSVLTTNPFRVLGQKKIILSGCGGSSSFLDARRLPKISSNLVVTSEAICTAMEEMITRPLWIGGTYRVGLIQQEGTLNLAEDIGRHSALDKAIGYGLKNRLTLAETFVVTSGNTSSEMVRKCLVAGIPILASQGATTTLAIELAEETGLCLAGFVSGHTMNIYSHAEHIRAFPVISE